MYRDIPEELRALIEPVVEDHGLELVDASFMGGRDLLRIIVDTPRSDGRVPIDRCAAVSREIGTQLDAADAIQNAYRLEVSSPGLDRILAREKDFVAACGDEVRIETRQPLEGRRRFRGTLASFSDGIVRVCVDGQDFEIAFADIAKASSVYKFTSKDFSGEGDAR